jgi:hypothetical protein
VEQKGGESMKRLHKLTTAVAAVVGPALFVIFETAGRRIP